MPKAARNLEPTQPQEAHPPVNGFKKSRFNVFLVTGDDALWPLVGADLSGDLILKQLDSIHELLSIVPSGQAGIVLWDVRGQTSFAADLCTLNLHSSCFAVVILDDNGAAGTWTIPLQQRQIVAHVGLPLSNVMLGRALEAGREEVGARAALLGNPPGEPVQYENAPGRKGWLPFAVGGVVTLAGAVAFVLLRGGNPPAAPVVAGENKTVTATASTPLKPAGTTTAAGTSGGSGEASDEKVDNLIETAQQAMLERHFIDPAAGSALSLYRDVLIIEPRNGEARQGLQRLEEILVTRVQSALDERKFDLALQSLETARSIDPDDVRLTSLDERIASLRAELGPAQISAAINAQNFERAAQLIDDAVRANSIVPPKLAQLREELRKRRDEADLSRTQKLIDTRLQQGRLVDPRTDSAAFYLEQATQAGVPAAALQAQYAELERQLALAVRGAIDTKHFIDAETGLAAMRDAGAAGALIGGLQKDLAAARTSAAAQVEQPQIKQPQVQQPQVQQPQVKAPQVEQPLEASATPKAQTALPPGKPAPVAAIPEVAEQSLTRLNKLEVIYPPRALERGLGGWVEIGFTVDADGTVGNVVVLGAAPANTFEQAGTKAVSKLRYQPVLQGGQPVAVNSHLRVVFRIPK